MSFSGCSVGCTIAWAVRLTTTCSTGGSDIRCRRSPNSTSHSTRTRVRPSRSNCRRPPRPRFPAQPAPVASGRPPRTTRPGRVGRLRLIACSFPHPFVIVINTGSALHTENSENGPKISLATKTHTFIFTLII